MKKEKKKKENICYTNNIKNYNPTFQIIHIKRVECVYLNIMRILKISKGIKIYQI